MLALLSAFGWQKHLCDISSLIQWGCLCDNWKPSFLPCLKFNRCTFSRRVTGRWSRGWARNQVTTNQNLRNSWGQIARRTICNYPISHFFGDAPVNKLDNYRLWTWLIFVSMILVVFSASMGSADLRVSFFKRIWEIQFTYNEVSQEPGGVFRWLILDPWNVFKD